MTDPTRDELAVMAQRQLPRVRQFVADACDSKHVRELILILEGYLAEFAQPRDENAALKDAILSATVERDGWHQNYEEERSCRSEAEDELAALKRGEFICTKCGLRKDSDESNQAVDF